jgi:hypothetical protein
MTTDDDFPSYPLDEAWMADQRARAERALAERQARIERFERGVAERKAAKVAKAAKAKLPPITTETRRRLALTLNADQRARALDRELIEYALSADPVEATSRWWASGLTPEYAEGLVKQLELIDVECARNIRLALHLANHGVLGDKASYQAYGERALQRLK